MQPPRGLGAEGRRSFDHACETLRSTGDDPQLYADAIRRYAIASDMAALLRRAWVARGSSVLATGSKGQAVTHPLVREIAEQERHVGKLAESLLLTPESRVRASRARGGRPQGASQAPDRRGLRVLRPSE
jgi:hypothetical protein